jgi:hypothetical protein
VTSTRQNGGTILRQGGKLLISYGVLVHSINTVVSIHGNKGSRSVNLVSDRKPVSSLGLRKFTNFWLVNDAVQLLIEYLVD